MTPTNFLRTFLLLVTTYIFREELKRLLNW